MFVGVFVVFGDLLCVLDCVIYTYVNIVNLI
jgi:hypothetical protein